MLERYAMAVGQYACSTIRNGHFHITTTTNVDIAFNIADRMQYIVHQIDNVFTQTLATSTTPQIHTPPPEGLYVDYDELLAYDSPNIAISQPIRQQLKQFNRHDAETMLTNLCRMACRIYIFGEPYRNNTGIHDIHRNDDSNGKFTRFNGNHQDGALYFQLDPSSSQMTRVITLFPAQIPMLELKIANPKFRCIKCGACLY